MHAKYLALLGLSSVAMGQDWLSDAMDALESTTDLPVPTGDFGDIPSLDEWISSDLPGSLTDSSSGSSITSGPSSDDSESSDDSSSGGGFGGILSDIPSSILTELATAIPTSVLSEFANPSYVSSVVSEAREGNYPDWVSDLPSDVRNYIETAWNTDASPTGGPTNGDDDSSSGGDGEDDGEGDGAGMVNPSIFASLVGAAGVLALAVAL